MTTADPSPAVPAATLAAAHAALAAAHAGDPGRSAEVIPEARYADAVEAWVRRLVPAPSVPLALAARAQHLERWAIPRASFPQDRPGYLAWRRAVHQRQGERARTLLLGAGCAPELAARVAQLVAKAAPKGDVEGQALEDAACLVFLEAELGAFATSHADYPREKFIDIIRKTWRKMSPGAHELALGIPLSAELKALVVAAVAG